MSLDELKCAASEIKSLRPVQEAIVRFFKLDTWEEAKAEFGKEVSPEMLLWFAVSMTNPNRLVSIHVHFVKHKFCDCHRHFFSFQWDFDVFQVLNTTHSF